MPIPVAAIDLYFDFLSPFAYFAWVRLRRREAEGLIQITPHPVVFGALLDHWGHKGPAEIPPKRALTGKTCLRFAALAGIPFQFPKTHPFNPLTPLRAALPEVAGRDQKRVIDAIFRAGWQEGLDLGDAGVIATVLTDAGLDGAALVQSTAAPAAKDHLRKSTANAVALGVFGVPTMAVGGELFWGNDQIETMDAFLAGNDPLDPKRLAEMLARPAAVQRKTPPAPAMASGSPAIDRIFYEAPFLATVGIKLVAYGDGWCEASLGVESRHHQQDGFVHAGVLATLADHTAGTAAGTLMPAGHKVLSIEFKINLLRPAVGEQLRCRAVVLRAGRTVTVAESEVFVTTAAGKETLVAKATVTLAVVAI